MIACLSGVPNAVDVASAIIIPAPAYYCKLFPGRANQSLEQYIVNSCRLHSYDDYTLPSAVSGHIKEHAHGI
jgi:hypothetical protein